MTESQSIAKINKLSKAWRKQHYNYTTETNPELKQANKTQLLSLADKLIKAHAEYLSLVS